MVTNELLLEIDHLVKAPVLCSVPVSPDSLPDSELWLLHGSHMSLSVDATPHICGAMGKGLGL